MTIFSRETLLLNVLNELAEKTNLKSSDLVFLNYDFSNQEITDLMAVLSEKQLKKAPITDQEFEKIVAVAKPDLQGIHSVCQQLVTTFIAEERFLAVFDDGTCHPSN